MDPKFVEAQKEKSESARKLMLTEARYARPTMEQKALNSLDTEMKKILYSDKDDNTKTLLYLNTLKRYRSYIEPKKQQEDENKVENNVLKSVPYNKQFLAKRILNELEKHNVDLKIDDNRSLTYHRQPIAQSNVIDIISQLVDNKGKDVPGMK